MKDNKNLTGKNASKAGFKATITSSISRNVTVVPQAKPNNDMTILDANHKLARRYSFDDNGGGYKGL